MTPPAPPRHDLVLAFLAVLAGLGTVALVLVLVGAFPATCPGPMAAGVRG